MTDTTTPDTIELEYEGNVFGTFNEVRDHIRAQFPRAGGNRKRQDELFADLAEVDRLEREYLDKVEAETAWERRETNLGGQTVGEGFARRFNSPDALRHRAAVAEKTAKLAEELLDRPSPEERAHRFIEARRAEAARLRAAAATATTAEPKTTPSDDDNWPEGWQ